MTLKTVPAGANAPHEINVIVEIPMDADPIKYEVDKDSGAIFVDRVLTTPMRYPCNYGYMPQTLCGDGDPIDVLIVMPVPLIPGAVIRCRPIGLLDMRDENGEDTKILAVPAERVFPAYREVASVFDLPETTLRRIEHFFQHYKDLEAGKWVTLHGWKGPAAARQEIETCLRRYAPTDSSVPAAVEGN